MTLASREPKPLGQFAARALTDRIKRAADDLWSLLLEAHEGKAWASLGYTNWTEYVQTEFDMSRRHSYRLLDAGRVLRALESVTHGTHVDLTEREARDLAPVLNEVAESVRVRTAGVSKERASEIVREEVERHRKRKDSARSAKALMDELNPPDFDPIADQQRTARVGAFKAALQKTLELLPPADLIPLFRPAWFEYVEMVPKAIAYLTEFEQEWRKVHG